MSDASKKTVQPEADLQSRFPTAYTILFALIILVAALTWMIPAGQYDRVMNEEVGRDVAVPGTYQTVESNPQGLTEVLLAPIGGFYNPDSYAANAIDVALFVLMLGGFLGVVNATGAINTGIKRAVRDGGARDLDDPDPDGALCGGRHQLRHGRGNAGLLCHPVAGGAARGL